MEILRLWTPLPQPLSAPTLQREMRARGMRTEDGVRSEIRALGRGELLRPGGADASGAAIDAAEPCPILSDEWHLLDDVSPPDAAVLDLDLQPGGIWVCNLLCRSTSH